MYVIKSVRFDIAHDPSPRYLTKGNGEIDSSTRQKNAYRHAYKDDAILLLRQLREDARYWCFDFAIVRLVPKRDELRLDDTSGECHEYCVRLRTSTEPGTFVLYLNDGESAVDMTADDAAQIEAFLSKHAPRP